MATAYLTKKTYGEKLLDPRWQKMRLEIFERENYTCQYCGDTENTLHVHHLSYYKNKEPWEVDPTSLLCLCQSCHEACHLSNLTPSEKYMLSEIQLRGLMLNNTDDGFKWFVRGITDYLLNQKNGKNPKY